MAGRNVQAGFIGIGGLPASGKTTLGLALADRLGDAAVLIDSDAVWYRERGLMPCLDTITLAQNHYWMGLLLGRAAHAWRENKTSIIVHHFGGPRQRKLVELMPRLLRAGFHGFWLMVPEAVAAERAQQRQNLYKQGIPDPYNFSIANASKESPENFARPVHKMWCRIDAHKSRQTVLNDVWAHLHPEAKYQAVDLGVARPQAGQPIAALKI